MLADRKISSGGKFIVHRKLGCLILDIPGTCYLQNARYFLFNIILCHILHKHMSESWTLCTYY